MQQCNSNKNLLVVSEFFSDGGEVHGLLDDFPVSRYSFVVDWCEKGPGILMGLQLGQQHSGGNKTKLSLRPTITVSFIVTLRIWYDIK